MEKHPRDLGELRRALEAVNAEYRELVRNCRDVSRLARMAELKRARLDLVTRIVHAEGSGRLAG